MKTVKISVFASGVTLGVLLSVAPFFNFAYAQSSADPARLVLEMQTLRAEIAELRDMVERQQFEIRKLKRAAQNQPSQQPPVAPSVGYQPAYPNASSDTGTQNLPTNPQASSPAGQVYSDNQYQAPYQSSQDDTNYQNDAAAKQTNIPSENGYPTQPEQNGLPEVADRPITAPSQSNSAQKNSGPEIVERSIDGYQGANGAPILSSEQATNVSQTPAPNTNPNTNIGDANGAIDASELFSVPNSNLPNPDLPNSSAVSVPVVPNNGGNRPVLQVPQQVESATATATPAPAANSQPSTGLSEDQFYDRGFDLLKQSKYDDAVTVFKDQLKQHPNGDLADDAHYWIAEAMFISRKPNEAKPHLRAIIDNYPQSARLPDAMLKTAYIEQDTGNVIEARILLQEIINRHPSSNAAIAAKNRLANITNGQ